MPYLTILTFLPLVGVVTILLLKSFNNETDRNIKVIATGTAVVTFIFSLVVLGQYNAAVPGLQLVDRGDWIPALGVSYYMGVDGISILMVLLTTFIAMLGIASSWSSITTQVRNYYIFMLLLEVGMLGVFLAQDLFLFYIFWEFTLVPMYFLIGIWGGKERVYASLKFFLYTMAGSLLMLLAILYMGITRTPSPCPNSSNAAPLGMCKIAFPGALPSPSVKVPVWPLPFVVARCPHPSPHGRLNRLGRRFAQDGYLWADAL
jgi:NADH-quinone oxidoreductase subunit M